MTTEDWKKALDQLAAEGIKDVCFAGGEPLLVRDLPLLVAHACELGMKAGLTTSGYLLNEQKLHDLRTAGLGSVIISIDGVGEGYERIRRREWKNVLQAVELLAKARDEKTFEVAIGFVLMKPTLANYADVQALARRLNLPLAISLISETPFLFLRPENPRENWIDSSSIGELHQVQREAAAWKSEEKSNLYGSYADIDFFEAYFRDPLQAQIPCTASQRRIVINGRGDVYGGCWSMGDFGNLRHQSLREIVKSKKYRDVHRAMFYKQCPGCSCGYGISNHYDLTQQVKALSYRLWPRLRGRIGAPGRERTFPV